MGYRLRLPKKLPIVDFRTSKTVEIASKGWFLEIIDDNKFGESAQLLFLREGLEQKIRMSDGEEYVLTASEYAKLKEVVEEPTGGYQTKIAKQMLPFIKGVLAAEKIEDE